MKPFVRIMSQIDRKPSPDHFWDTKATSHHFHGGHFFGHFLGPKEISTLACSPGADESFWVPTMREMFTSTQKCLSTLVYLCLRKTIAEAGDKMSRKVHEIPSTQISRLLREANVSAGEFSVFSALPCILSAFKILNCVKTSSSPSIPRAPKKLDFVRRGN